MGFQRLELLIARFSVVPWLEGDEEGCVVAGTNKTQQAKPDEAR